MNYKLIYICEGDSCFYYYGSILISLKNYRRKSIVNNNGY